MAQQDWCRFLGSTVTTSLDLVVGSEEAKEGLGDEGDGAWTTRRDADVGEDRDGA